MVNIHKPLRSSLNKIVNSNTDATTPFELLQLEYAINVQKRYVYLEQCIDLTTPTIIYERINAVAQISKDEVTPITLLINNYGGSVHGMFGLYDLLQTLPMKINTLGTGAVMSAAVLILVGVNGTRKITPNTSVMVHQVSTWLSGNVTDIITETAQTTFLQDRLFVLLEKHTKKDIKFWKRSCKSNNLYLTAEKCMEYGLIDEIG